MAIATTSEKRRNLAKCRLSSSARAAKLRRRAPPRCASGKFLAEETGMAMRLGHVHIKTREDPQKVAKFYIDNFGATVKREIPGRGCQLDLHGVQLNVTTIIADQNHEQHVGIEHIAIETDEYAGALANFRKNGAQILEERVNNGRCRARRRADGADREGLRTGPPHSYTPAGGGTPKPG
jgi:predicted enzyme related to lactoylglutathione lyase